MAITAGVSDGKIVNTTSSSKTSSSKSSTTAAKGTNLGEDDFLELLVAEMKYQDPLEPQSNTDYIAQLATFTQVQDINNMQDTITSMQASSLVGQYVTLAVTSSTTGATSSIEGQVNYVTYENGEAYLSVNGTSYPISDLTNVVGTDYYEALIAVSDFSEAVSALPSVDDLTKADSTAVTAARKLYTDMTSYQKNFVSATDLKTLTALETQLTKLTSSSSSSSSGSGA